MKDIIVAVVGAGYWGPNLIRNFGKINNARVAAVCDTDKKRLAPIKKSYPGIRTTDDFSTILKDETITFVVIATPLQTHFALAKQVLLSGKHVMVEKPLTRTSSEAKELIKLAERKKLQIFCGHTYVYHAAIQKMKQLLTKGVLGKTYYYESMRANLGLIQNDANVLWDLAPHDFSILRFLFPSKPVAVRVVANRYVHKSQEEVAHVFLRFSNGMMAHMYLSWLSPLKIRTVMIAGAKKMLLFDQQDPVETLRIYDKGVSITGSKHQAYRSRYRYGDIVVPTIEESEALSNELEHFISCILKKKKPLTGGREGLEVVKMLEAAEKSYRTGREIPITL